MSELTVYIIVVNVRVWKLSILYDYSPHSNNYLDLCFFFSHLLDFGQYKQFALLHSAGKWHKNKQETFTLHEYHFTDSFDFYMHRIS